MNRVCIQPCQFIDVRSGDISYGYRIFDNCDKSYSNLWEKIPDDDMEILDDLLDEGDAITDSILNYVTENEIGITIGEKYYEWEKIKDILTK